MVKSHSKKVSVVVTGGAGFIGSHLVDLLVARGYDTFSIDNYVSSFGRLLEDRNNPNARYIKCDIRDFSKIKNHFMKIRPKYVFHTAALARIQPSIKRPQEYLDVNSGGTLNVLMASKACGVKRVIYSASSSAYGLNPIPSLESMRPDPLNPYAKTKLDGEQWMKVFSAIYGVETASLRYFNVYGPRNVFNGPYTTVVTKFFHFYKKGQTMDIVGDGKQTRDYTHVYDVVRANLLAAHSKNVGNGEVINVGCGKQHSVNKIAELVCGASIARLKARGIVKHGEVRVGESRHTRADNSKAKKLLGWQPKVEFNTGIAELKNIYKIS